MGKQKGTGRPSGSGPIGRHVGKSGGTIPQRKEPLRSCMNYNDTPDEAVFRKEVRSFIQKEAPKNVVRGEGMGGGGSAWDTWVAKLAERGWVAPAWPKEHGGGGMSVMEQFIFNWEMAEARAPRPGGIA